MHRSGSTCRYRLPDSIGSEYLRSSIPAGRTASGTLVLVHGQSRDVDALVSAFLPWSARTGLELIAPEFTHKRHIGYQRLLTSDPRRSAVDVLDDVLADAGIADDERILIFGFSGGAQFAHRYAIARPDRIAALSIAAAGWYTFPTPHQSFPYGVAPGNPLLQEVNLLPGLLSIPVQVLVGDCDTNRDESLRCTRRVDRQQGPNRVTRALAWVEAMRRLAPAAGPPELEILPRAGHRFADCVEAGMIQRATSWLQRHLDVNRQRSPQHVPPAQMHRTTRQL